MHGEGVFTFNDGRKYIGMYVNDKKHGRGIYFWSDGRKYDGEWHEGVQHGMGIYYNPEGTYKVGLWDNGKRIKWLTNEEIEKINPLVNWKKH